MNDTGHVQTTASAPMSTVVCLSVQLAELLERSGHTVRHISVWCSDDPAVGAEINAKIAEMSEGAAWLLGLTQRSVHEQNDGPGEIVYWGTWTGMDVTLSGPASIGRDL